jgi:hypothetical protein
MKYHYEIPQLINVEIYNLKVLNSNVQPDLWPRHYFLVKRLRR